MVVTINTDASFHPEHRVGAYAFWIVCDQGKMMQSGALKDARHPQDAEMKCIANALYALNKSTFTNVKYIVINTDCQYGIYAIKNKDKKYMKGCEKVVSLIDKIISQLRKKYDIGPKVFRKKTFISWRYVKAHTEGEDGRSWVNNWCDKAAKKALWDLINSKNKPT